VRDERDVGGDERAREVEHDRRDDARRAAVQRDLRDRVRRRLAEQQVRPGRIDRHEAAERERRGRVERLHDVAGRGVDFDDRAAVEDREMTVRQAVHASGERAARSGRDRGVLPAWAGRDRRNGRGGKQRDGERRDDERTTRHGTTPGAPSRCRVGTAPRAPRPGVVRRARERSTEEWAPGGAILALFRGARR
jgi:hypothetical protein